MSKPTTITPEQKKAIKHTVAYLIKDERRHLEEMLSDKDDDKYGKNLSDKELVEACKKEKLTKHAWYQLHILSTIK
jgi:hypothetical protein